MRILCDTDGWQKVIEADAGKDRVTVALHEPMSTYAYKEVSIKDTFFTVPLHYTGYVINGLPLYALRSYNK